MQAERNHCLKEYNKRVAEVARLKAEFYADCNALGLVPVVENESSDIYECVSFAGWKYIMKTNKHNPTAISFDFHQDYSLINIEKTPLQLVSEELIKQGWQPPKRVKTA